MATMDKADISVSAGGDIRKDGLASNHTGLEFYRLMMDLNDDHTATGNDYLDVTTEIIPMIKKTDQIFILVAPYNVDDAFVENIFGCSIEQIGGDELYSGLKFLGTVNSATELMVAQAGALLTSHWSTGKNADPTQNILNRIMVKSRTGGVDIDGKRVLSHAREWGDTYAEFPTTLGEGEQVSAISTTADAFNKSSEGTIAGYSADFTWVDGFQALDIDFDGTNEDYAGSWNIGGGRTRNDLYEYHKYITRRGSVDTTLFGRAGQLFRGITHEIDYISQTVNFTQNETLTFSNGATALLIADDDNGATGTIWIQLLTGVAPSDTDTISGASGDGVVSGAPTARTLSPVSIGAFTGNYITAYGMAVLREDLTKDDTVTALDAIGYNPPNNVTVAVTSLASTAPYDRVLLARTKTANYTVDASAYSIGDTAITMTGAINTDDPTIGKIVINGLSYTYASYTGSIVTLAGTGLTEALTGGEDASITSWNTEDYTATGVHGADYTTLTVSATITKDIPTAGFIRVYNIANAVFDRYEYTSFSGTDFTLSAGAKDALAGGESVYIPFIDEETTGTLISKAIVYSTDISALMRIYNAVGNIVPFEVPVTIGSNGSSTPAIRTSDA